MRIKPRCNVTLEPELVREVHRLFGPRSLSSLLGRLLKAYLRDRNKALPTEGKEE